MRIVLLAVAIALFTRWGNLIAVPTGNRCIIGESVRRVEFKRNCRFERNGVEFQTNSLGIRAPEPGELMGTETFRVLYLGFSESEVLGTASSDERISAQLENELNRKRLSEIQESDRLQRRVRVIDGSMPMIESRDLLVRGRELIESYRPHLVVVLYVPSEFDIDRSVGVHFGRASPTDWQNQLQSARMSWALRFSGQPEVALLIPLVRELESLSEESQKSHAQFLVVWPGLGLIPAKWSPRIFRTWDGLALRVLDLFKAPIGIPPSRVERAIGAGRYETAEVKEMGPVLLRKAVWSNDSRAQMARQAGRLLADAIHPKVVSAGNF